MDANEYYTAVFMNELERQELDKVAMDLRTKKGFKNPLRAIKEYRQSRAAAKATRAPASTGKGRGKLLIGPAAYAGTAAALGTGGALMARRKKQKKS